MNATITNYRGLASASLDITKICLISGPNEAGKTSASQAVAAALTGDPVPIHGVKKTQAGMLVRSGTASGSIELVTEQGKTLIQWPSAKVKTEGQAPFASHFATGLRSIISLDDKERVKTLTEYLKAVPVRADMDAQLTGLKLSDDILAKLWELIETQGWDNAANQIKEKGARLKGQWQQATGEQYGSKKADSWIPEGYESGLEGQSEDKLKSIVSDARDSLEAAIATDAVDDSKRAEWEEVAALKSERETAWRAAQAAPVDTAIKAQLDEANGFIKELNGKRDALTKELSELPSAEQPKGMPCPECGTVLNIIFGKILKPASDITADELKSREKAIKEVQAKLDGVNEAISKHMQAVSELKHKIIDADKEREAAILETARLLKESVQAEEKLKKPAQAGAKIDIDGCRTTLALAEKTLKAFQSKTEADRLHIAIGKNQELLDKISPEGIRGDVLLRALKRFDDLVAPFSKAAGWRPVALDQDLMPTYGGTPYLLLSESAKFRVRILLAVGMAKLDKSEALVIDAADILDKTGRNGLFRMVKSTGLPCLIAMTIDNKELVPDLKKSGIGVSYWITEGVAEAV